MTSLNMTHFFTLPQSQISTDSFFYLFVVPHIKIDVFPASYSRPSPLCKKIKYAKSMEDQEILVIGQVSTQSSNRSSPHHRPSKIFSILSLLRLVGKRLVFIQLLHANVICESFITLSVKVQCTLFIFLYTLVKSYVVKWP